MKEIRSPNLRLMLSFNSKHTTLSDFYFFNQSFFNKFSLSLIFILLNLFLGIFFRYCLVLGLSSVVFLIYLYFKVKKLSECLSIKRKAPNIGREFDSISVEYNLFNSASFPIDNFYIIENFDGIKEKTTKIETIETIPQQTFYKFKKAFKLNSGMGIKYFGPITIYISDPLNIFHFQIIENKIDEIKVFPQIEKIKEMILKGNQYSMNFGIFDTPARGDTTNFIGIKPYRPGDPVKRINWKLTLKTKKTVLNEFEKNVNATLAIILNLDEKLQMGKESVSTWEYAKDICLAIATQQIKNGNEVQFFSNDIFIPANSGQEHINYLELVVCTLPLSKSLYCSQLVEKSMAEISNESKVLFITSTLAHHSFEENISSIKKHAKFNSNIHVVIIDGTKFMTNAMKGNTYLALIGIFNETQKLIERTIIDLQALGVKISVVVISNEVSYQSQISDSLNIHHGLNFE